MSEHKESAVHGSSGKVLKGSIIKLRFIEFTEIDYPSIPVRQSPSYVDVFGYHINITPVDHIYEDLLPYPEYEGIKPVKEQWIYIFELKPSRKNPDGYVSLAGELWADKSGKYHQVVWGKNTRDEYSKLNERPTGNARDNFVFRLEGTAYFFISKFPLSADRLKLYLHSPETVKLRSRKLSLNNPLPASFPDTPSQQIINLHKEPQINQIEPGQLREVAGSNNTYELFLINQVDLLLNMHNKYKTALNEYNTYIGNKKKAHERLLVSLTLSTAHSYIKAKGWNKENDLNELDFNELRKDQWQLHKEIFEAKKKKEWWGNELGNRMRKMTFIEMRKDLWDGNKEAKVWWVEFEGAISKDLYQSDTGREFIKWSMKQNDNLFERLLKSHAETGKLAFNLSNTGVDTINKAIDFLINFAVLKTGDAETIRDMYMHYLPNTFKILDIPLEEVGVNFIKDKKVIRRTLDDMNKVLFDLDMRYDLKSIEPLEKIRKIMPRILLFFNIINLVYEARALQDKKSGIQTYAQLANIGAAASTTISSLKDIFVEEGTEEYATFEVIGIFGAILSAVSSGLNAYEAVKDDNDMQAIGYGLTAAASLMMIAGITNPIFAIGLILFVVGSFLIAIFTTTPIEKWFSKCKWGNKFEGLAKYPISDQLKDLLILIGRPKIEFQISEKDRMTKTKYQNKAEYFSLILKPTFFMNPDTKFKVSFKLGKIIRGTFNSSVFEETIIIPADDDDIIFYDKNGSVEKIIHNWKLTQVNVKFVKRDTDMFLGGDSNIDIPFGLDYDIQPKFLSSWNDFAKKGYNAMKREYIGLE